MVGRAWEYEISRGCVGRKIKDVLRIGWFGAVRSSGVLDQVYQTGVSIYEDKFLPYSGIAFDQCMRADRHTALDPHLFRGCDNCCPGMWSKWCKDGG